MGGGGDNDGREGVDSHPLPLQHSLSSLHFVLFFFPTMSEKSLESFSENVIVSIINQEASSVIFMLLLFVCFSGDYFSFILLGRYLGWFLE